MSYEPTNWKSGDVVTSAKLNKLEQGVAEAGSGGGGVLVVNVTDVDGTPTCDKTAGEMAAALESGGIIFRWADGAVYNYGTLSVAEVEAGVHYAFNAFGTAFVATSSSDYPVANEIT